MKRQGLVEVIVFDDLPRTAPHRFHSTADNDEIYSPLIVSDCSDVAGFQFINISVTPHTL